MSSVDLYSPSFISVFLSFLLHLHLSFAEFPDEQNVITVTRGETAILPCSSLFLNSHRYNFKWKKDGENLPCQYYLEQNKTVHNCQARFKVNLEPFGLTITNVRRSDAGDYNCTITKVLPPPTEEQHHLLTLKVEPGLTLEKMNSSNCSCVNLLCSLEGLSQWQVDFNWTRKSEQLRYQKAQNISSSLQLCKPHWTDGDTITCHARDSRTQKLYSENITLNYSNKECISEIPWLLIGPIVGGFVGLLLIFFLIFALCKCKKKEDPTGSIVFSNKVYENLNFFTTRPSTAPGATLNSRPNPLGEYQTRREECIYEN